MSVLRRSNRLKAKQNTLDRLLEIPSTSEQIEAKKREAYYQDIESQRKKRQRLADTKESEHEHRMKENGITRKGSRPINILS